MTENRICNFCNKDFLLKNKKRVGRFCSSLCNRKILRKKQLENYNEYLKNETDDQRISWLKSHYNKFVIRNEGCWEWSGCRTKGGTSNGYAMLNHRGKTMKGHRVSWIIHNGPIPDGLFVLHKCDIRHCTNPDHLFLGNQKINMQDMASKRRTKVRCKLTEEQVVNIKKLLNLGVSMKRISQDYNVSSNAIFGIKHGITWKHIS